MKIGCPFEIKSALYVFFAYLLLHPIGALADGDFDWNIPVYKFDNINELGFVDVWTNLGSLKLGAHQDIPINIEFQSARNSSSPILGKGWYFPLLESHIEQQDENNFIVYLPDGRKLSFYRSKDNPNLLNGPGDWKAQINNNTIDAWIDKKSKLTFTDGMITNIALPDGESIDFLYSGKVPVEIRKGEVTLLKVNTDPTSQQVTGISWANGAENHEASLTMSNRPRVDFVGGTPVIGGVDRCLNEIKVLGGSDLKYDYAVTDKMIPSLKITNGAGDTTLSWDPIQHNVLTENDDRYTINDSDQILSIAASNTKTGNTRKWIRAVDGSTESYSDGSFNYNTTYFTSGMLQNRPRTNIITDDGVSTTEAYTYNEQGALIRTMYSDGVQTIVKDWQKKQ